MAANLFLRARGSMGNFSSFKEVVAAGLRKDMIEIAGPGIYVAIKPEEEISVILNEEAKKQTMEGPVFRAEALGLTQEGRPINYDSLAIGFLALLDGAIDYLQIYETEGIRGEGACDYNNSIDFFKNGKNGKIRFSCGREDKLEIIATKWQE